MKALIFTLPLVFSSLSYGAVGDEVRVIPRKQKDVISCPGRNTHLFCEVRQTFDTPGICGHGFDCIMLKAGEKRTVCSVVFACAD